MTVFIKWNSTHYDDREAIIFFNKKAIIAMLWCFLCYQHGSTFEQTTKWPWNTTLMWRHAIVHTPPAIYRYICVYTAHKPERCQKQVYFIFILRIKHSSSFSSSYNKQDVNNE